MEIDTDEIIEYDPIYSENEDCTVNNQNVKNRKRTIRYPKDVKDEDFQNFDSAKRAFEVCLKSLESYKKKNFILKQKLKRKDEKVKSLQEMVTKLKDQNLISDNSEDVLQVNFCKNVSFDKLSL